MLEGLEISVLNYSEILFENDNHRLDSEYFRKHFLKFFNNVSNLKPLEFFVERGYRVVYENTQIVDSNEAIKKDFPYFLQASDLDTPFIRTDNLFHVHEEDWNKYKKGRIAKGEILIEVKGKVEKVSIVPENFPSKTLVSGSLFKLTVNNKISKHFLLTFLLCKYGAAFKDRFKTNLLISYISKPDLYRIPVPLLSLEFQKKIDILFKVIFDSKEQANIKYNSAENQLLSAIGIHQFAPNQDKVNIKNFKESFLSTGRLDAEYYQKKYEEILQEIRQHKNNLLGNLVTIEKSIEPGSEAYSSQGIPFIRVSNLSKHGITNPEISLDEEEFCNVIMPTKNTILLSKDGTVGIAYKVTENIKSITSSAILHLKIKTNEVLPDYLTLVLNSIIVQMQAERDAGGSVLQHWKPSEIAEVEIPILDMEIQEKISKLVQESFSFKKQSEDLLELAKRAVEVAIEDGEEAGMRLIEEYEINLNL